MKDLNHKTAKRPVRNIIFRILLCILVLAVGIFGMTKLASLKKRPAEAKNEERALRVEAVRVKEAPQQAVDLEKNLKNRRITVSSEVGDSLAQLLSAQEQLRLQRINAELVQTNRDLVDKEYTAGQASLVRLNAAQRDLVTAQSRLALALASLRLIWYSLETDTGHILEVLKDTYK